MDRRNLEQLVNCLVFSFAVKILLILIKCRLHRVSECVVKFFVRLYYLLKLKEST